MYLEIEVTTCTCNKCLFWRMTPGARLANDGRKEIIDEMVTDLFQKIAAGKVT